MPCSQLTCILLTHTEISSGNHMISDKLELSSPLGWIWIWSGRRFWQHLEWSPQGSRCSRKQIYTAAAGGPPPAPSPTSREGEAWKIGQSDPVHGSSPGDCSIQYLLIQSKFLHVGIAHEKRDSWATLPFWVGFVFLKPSIKDPDLGPHNSVPLSPSLSWEQRNWFCLPSTYYRCHRNYFPSLGN